MQLYKRTNNIKRVILFAHEDDLCKAGKTLLWDGVNESSYAVRHSFLNKRPQGPSVTEAQIQLLRNNHVQLTPSESFTLYEVRLCANASSCGKRFVEAVQVSGGPSHRALQTPLSAVAQIERGMMDGPIALINIMASGNIP